MTGDNSHAVFVCRDCPLAFSLRDGETEGELKQRADAHVAVATGHHVVLHRVKMAWEVG